MSESMGMEGWNDRRTSQNVVHQVLLKATLYFILFHLKTSLSFLTCSTVHIYQFIFYHLTFLNLTTLTYSLLFVENLKCVSVPDESRFCASITAVHEGLLRYDINLRSGRAAGQHKPGIAWFNIALDRTYFLFARSFVVGTICGLSDMERCCCIIAIKFFLVFCWLADLAPACLSLVAAY